ncbi:MAG: PEP-CTERM sorting domain-containing protein [Rhodocyclaceae bacterium]|nr:PEP-CTERM sorting domain-containing protein [Rhodocyclaceae bacterium]
MLNVTWLQDANYAKTSLYDSDGRMNWADANTWAADLVYHDSVRGVDYDDWRLARNSPVGSAWNYTTSNNGSTDFAFNIASPKSELAYMYYVNLGLKGFYSTSGSRRTDYGIFGNGTCNGVDCSSYGQADVGLVKNLQALVYWSGTADARYAAELAWALHNDGGRQFSRFQHSEWYAWAVRPGDVAAVPEPETYAMFLAGLAVMGGAVRRRTGKAD